MFLSSVVQICTTYNAKGIPVSLYNDVRWLNNSEHHPYYISTADQNSLSVVNYLRRKNLPKLFSAAERLLTSELLLIYYAISSQVQNEDLYSREIVFQLCDARPNNSFCGNKNNPIFPGHVRSKLKAFSANI